MPQKKSTQIFKTDLVNVGIGQGQKEISPYLYSHTEYNSEGKVVMQSIYNPSGLIVEKNTTEYDDAGRMIRESYYAEEEEPSEIVTFEYDESGKVIGSKKLYGDGSEDITSYVYNDKNQLVEKITKTEEGELEMRETFSYSDGKPVQYEITDCEGERLLYEEFEYNDKGLTTLHIRDSDETGEYFKLQTEYNDAGQKVKEMIFDIDGNLVETTYFEIDEAGNTIHTIAQSGPYRKERKYNFDSRGNDLGYEEINAEGDSTIKVEHQYDTENNPVATTVFINGGGRSMSHHYALDYQYEWHE